MTFDDLSQDGRDFGRELAAAFAPPPDILPSEWAERNLVLTSDFAAEPGNYNLERTPWCRQPLDDAADPSVEVVSIGGASQMGKTQLSLAVAAYFAGVQPCSIMHVVPTDGLSETFASRIDSMVTASPVLRNKFVQPRRTRAISNRSIKTFEGGVLVLASAASPTELSSRPVKIAIADEIDRFGVLRKEGHPLQLIHARQQTFAGRKLYQISTPTQVGLSSIEAALDESTYHEWEIKCPHCGEHHRPAWENVEWETHKPETATYVMPCCGSALNDAERWKAGRAGRWAVVHEGRASHRGYRFNGLVSPWVTLAELVTAFVAAKGVPSRLQPFYNLKLGLPFDAEVGEGAHADTVRELVEVYSTSEMPRSAVLVTCGVDVQQNWLAVSTVAWGDADEGWVMSWDEIPGDTTDPRTWHALEEVLLRSWKHPSGEFRQIEAVAIDSGYRPQHVYEFSAKHRARGRRWWATKGMSGNRPMWQRGGDVHRSMSKLFLVGVDQAKEQIASGLMTTEGSGKLHVPLAIVEGAPHWIEWATAEERITRELPSGPKIEWRKKKGAARNEVFDTLVLALAAKFSHEFNIEQRLENLLRDGTIASPRPTIRDLAQRAAIAHA